MSKGIELIYSKADYGVGYLMSSDKKPLFVLLSGENIELACKRSAWLRAEIIKDERQCEMIKNEQHHEYCLS